MHFTRRQVALAGLASAIAPAAAAQETSYDFDEIDSKADAALAFLLENVRHASSLHEIAKGVLIMPLITEIGIIIGGSYGEGVLRINGESADYYLSHQLSYGLQFGGQQSSHILFFLNDKALDRFQNTSNWSFGAEIEGVMLEESQTESADSLTGSANVVGIIFGTAGMQIGASLKGTKYTRIQR